MSLFAAIFLFSSAIAPTEPVSQQNVDTPVQPAVAAKKKPKKICRADDRTGQGSRTAKRICKTAEQWGLVERESVDGQIESMGTKTR